MKLTIILLLLSQISFGQEKPNITTEEYRQMLVAIAEGNQALQDLKTYKALVDKDSIAIAKLQAEIIRKEGVIMSQIEKNKICYEAKGNLEKQVLQKDMVMNIQKQAIDKLAKPDKRFALTIGGGYGYLLDSSLKGGVVVSVGIGFKIFSF